VTDPRLAEIEFLTILQRTEQFHVRSQDELEKRLRISQQELKQMLFELIADGCVDGDKIRIRPGESFPPPPGLSHRDLHFESTRQTMVYLLAGQEFIVRMNHRGRLRLWRLRDELLAQRRRDRFGMLWDASHLEPDLHLGFLFTDPGAPVSLMFGDVDHFKQVNDTLGHEQGDEVLKIVFGAVLKVCAGLGEAYRRYAGDEFVVVLPGIAIEGAERLAESLRQTVEEQCQGVHVPKTPTVSIGVVSFIDRPTPARAIAAADAAMYAAKQIKNSVRRG
jgi:diguanylate cyclase (GGDEF)-like protein